jgi:hypothetical protein
MDVRTKCCQSGIRNESREIAKSSFSGESYLRGREQRLWIGKARKDMALSVYKRPSGEWITPLQ